MKSILFFNKSTLFAGIALSAIVAACSPTLNRNIGIVQTNTITNTGLQIVPASKLLAVGNQFQFAAAGGTPPYTFSIVSGRGTINASNGTYASPPDLQLALPTDPFESVKVKLTDGTGAVVEGEVGLVQLLAATSPTVSINPGETIILGATGGVGPYTYNVFAGQGTVNSSTGEFTSAVSGMTVVQITDAAGNGTLSIITVATAFGGQTETIPLMIGTTHFIGPSGGILPYNFTVLTAALPQPGSVSTATGGSSAYIAPPSMPVPSTIQVRIADSATPIASENFIDFQIQPQIAISPAVKFMGYGQVFNFAVSGGVGAPYTFSIQSGGSLGSMTAAGEFTAGSTSGTVIIKVMDTDSNVATGVVNINPSVLINPKTLDVVTGAGPVLFSASGGDPSGTPPYTYALTGVGSVVWNTGSFTAGGVPGTAVITATDTVGGSDTATVRVYTPLTFTPTRTLALGNSFTITPTTGLPPYNFEVLPNTSTGSFGGSPTASGASAVFTASPTTTGTLQIRITDDTSPSPQQTLIDVTITPALQISPTSSQVTISSIAPPASNTKLFSVTGGVGANTWDVIGAGCGSVNAAGLYTAPTAMTGPCSVRVSDSHTPPNTSTASVTLLPALALTPAAPAPLDLQGVVDVTASGGSGTYVFSLSNAGMGTLTVLSPTSRRFKANNIPGSVEIRVDDDLGSAPTGVSNVSIDTPAGLRDDTGAGTYTLAQTDNQSVLIGGGVPQYDPTQNYTFSFSPPCGLGTLLGDVTATTGKNVTFTATGGTGNCNIQVTDGVSAPMGITFNIVPDVQITPTNPTITMANTRDFDVTGGTGVPPFTYSNISAPGTMDGVTGLFTPSGTGTGTVRVTDARGHISNTTITVNTNLGHTKSPSLGLYDVLNTAQDEVVVTPTGGVPPYTIGFTGTAGHNASPTGVVPSTTVTLAPSDGTANVSIQDSIGNLINVPIPIILPAPLTAPSVNLGVITATSIAVSWSAVTMTNDNGTQPVTGYKYRIDGGGWTTVSNAVTSNNFTGLAGNVEHTIEVLAYSSGGDGPVGSVGQSICNIDYVLNGGVCDDCGQNFTSTGGTVVSCTACLNTIPNSQPGATWAPPRGCTLLDFTCSPGHGKNPLNPDATKCGLCAAGEASPGTAACAACTNATAGKYWNSAGQANTALCSDADCTNTPAVGKYWSTHGGTSPTGCTNTADCTNAPVGQYWTTHGGNSAIGCTNLACTNATIGFYWTSHGGTSSIGCTEAACTNTPAIGRYWSTHGGTSATGCTNTASCTNVNNGKYWTSHGGTSPIGCAEGNCNNATNGQYYTGHGGTNIAGCATTACGAPVSGAEYVIPNDCTTAGQDCSVGYGGSAPTACTICGPGTTKMTVGDIACTSCGAAPGGATYTTNNSCASVCSAGYGGTSPTCAACIIGTFKAANGNGACGPCTGLPANGTWTSAGGAGGTTDACTWQCNANYFSNAGACTNCIAGMNSAGFANGAVTAATSSAGSTLVSQCTAIAAVCDSGYIFSGGVCVVDVPGAPTGLNFTAITASSMTLNWNAVGGSTSYETSPDGSTWTDRGSGTSFNFTGLNAGTNYTYYVRAMNGPTPGPASVMVSSYTRPAAPGGLSITAITTSSMTLNWGAVTSATSYETSTDGLTWTNRGPGLSFNFTSLNAATPYNLYVRAVNSAGEGAGAFSSNSTNDCAAGTYRSGGVCLGCAVGSYCTGGTNNTSCVTGMNGAGFANGTVTTATSAANSTALAACSATAATCDSGYTFSAGACVAAPPGTPAGLNFTLVSASGMTLNWNAVGGATTYETSPDGSTWTNRGPSTSFAFTGLNAGTNYTWYVRAMNGPTPGTGASSSWYTLPAAPGGLSINAITTTSMTLNWSAVTGASSYETSEDASTWTDRGAGLSFNFTSLAVATPHTLYVRAKNSAGSGANSSSSASTNDCAAGTYRSGGVCLGCAVGSFCTGGTNNTSCVAGMNGAGFSNGVVTAATSAANSTSVAACTATAANCDGGYTFSAGSCVGAVPGTPAGLNYTLVTTTSMTLNWNAVGGATSYETSPDGSTWTNRGPSTSFNFTSLTAGTNYTWYVRAMNGPTPGTGASSSWYTLPVAPGGLSINAITTSSMTLNWSAVTSAASYETSTDGLIWTNRGPGLSFNFTSLAAAAAHNLYVRAVNSAGAGAGAFSTASTNDCAAGTYRSGGVCLGCAVGSYCTGGTNNTSCVTGMNGAGFANGTVTTATSAANSTALAACSATAATCDSGYTFSAGACVAAPPGTPAGLNFTLVTTTSMTLNWNAVGGATSYETSPDGSTWTNRGPSTSFAFTGLNAGTNYTWYVRAMNGPTPGTGASSSWYTLPAAPGGLSINAITTSSMTLNWSAVTGASSYETSEDASTWTDRGAGLSFNFTSLAAAAAHNLYVRAVNSAGVGASAFSTASTNDCAAGTYRSGGVCLGCTVGSYCTGGTNTTDCVTGMNGAGFANGTVTAATSAASSTSVAACTATAANCDSGYAFSAGACVAAPPGTPTGLSFLIATTNMRLYWDLVAGASSYETSPDGSTWTNRGNVDFFDFTGLSSGTQYTFYVRAMNGPTPGAAASLTAYTRPEAPTPWPDVIGADHLGFGWNPVTGAASYEVKLGALGTWMDVGMIYGYTFWLLNPDTLYRLYVRAKTADGNTGDEIFINMMTSSFFTNCTVNWNPNPSCDRPLASGVTHPFAIFGESVPSGAAVPAYSMYVDCSDQCMGDGDAFITCSNGSWLSSPFIPECSY